MNNAWNDPNYPFMDFSSHPLYSKTHNQIPVDIKPSEILFAGSCDIGGYNNYKHWYEIYCENLNLDHSNYVRIGHIGQPMSALVRKIYAYLNMVSTPPKQILMVAPISIPEQMLDGIMCPVPSDLDTISFFERTKLLSESSTIRLTNLMFSLRQATRQGQLTYDFCQNFSFLEMLTKFYNIKLRWTPNLTRRSTQYYKNIQLYLNNHSFAKETFIGYDPSIVDMSSTKVDIPTDDAQRALAQLFLKP